MCETRAKAHVNRLGQLELFSIPILKINSKYIWMNRHIDDVIRLLHYEVRDSSVNI